MRQEPEALQLTDEVKSNDSEEKQSRRREKNDDGKNGVGGWAIG